MVTQRCSVPHDGPALQSSSGFMELPDPKGSEPRRPETPECVTRAGALSKQSLPLLLILVPAEGKLKLAVLPSVTVCRDVPVVI